MANQLAHLYLSLKDVAEPVRRRFASPAALESLFYRYGWVVSLDDTAFTAVNQVTEFREPLEQFMAAAETIQQRLDEDPEASLTTDDIVALAEPAAVLIKALSEFKVSALTALPEPINSDDFWSSIGDHLLDDLLEEYLRVFQSGLYSALHLFGVIRYDAVTLDAPFRVPYRRTSVDWGQLLEVIKSPVSALKQTYRWNGSAAEPFEHERFLRALVSVLHALRLPAKLIVPSLRPPLALSMPAGQEVRVNAEGLRSTFVQGIGIRDQALYEIGLELFPASANGEAHVSGLLFKPVLRGGTASELPLSEDFVLRWQVAADAGNAIGLTLFPGQTDLIGGPLAIDTSVEISGTRTTPWYLLGNADTARIEFYNPSIGFSITGDASNPDVRLHVKASGPDSAPGCRVIVPLGDADNFIQQTLKRSSIDFGFSPEVIWSNKTGLVFNGHPSFDIDLPLSVKIGPLTITNANLALTEGKAETSNPGIALRVGLDVKGELGPVQFVVRKVGFECTIVPYSREEIAALPPGADGPMVGNLGVNLGFAPPTGLGLVIDASVVVGGGYIDFDPRKGEYGGVLQLEIADRIAVKAMGLLSTRLPDGSKGYSFIIFITAEGFQPIQLGMGFKLQGIGGMLAINRTFDEAALLEGLKNNTLATLLFPRDPVANAPEILRNLATVFPARLGSFLFGPLVKIGWATPTLIQLDLALIVEVGARHRLLVLGRISSILPSREKDLLRLNMDSMGVFDFDVGTISMDAVLVDSRLLQKFVLTGSMAMRACLVPGPRAGFALAVGGMNPHFAPPQSMPKLTRIAINLTSGDNPRFTCEAYFAVTANTIQFGARAAMYAAAHGFSVEGEVSFDVLIQLLPFHFLADFHASIQLKRGSRNLFKVKVAGALEGPLPLRVSAKATFEILWCDFSVRFDKTLIGGAKPPAPPGVDALAELIRALTAPDNWNTELPAGRHHGVSMRKLPPGAPLALDPLGEISVKQSVVPLNTERELDVFGGAPLAGERRFVITTATLNSEMQDGRPARTLFAPAQFFELSDEEKLASPSFEEMDSGIVFGSDTITFDETPNQRVYAPLEYDTIIVDEAGEDIPAPATYPLRADRLFQQVRFSAVAKSFVRQTGLARFSAAETVPAVTLATPRWVVASTANLTVLTPASAAGMTWGDARVALKQLRGRQPAGAANWQLLPSYEVPLPTPE